MITSEQAFDMLPHVTDIYDKLDLDSYKKELNESLKGKKVDNIEVGITVFKYVLKNSNKVKDEFFNIVAIAEEKPLDEVKKQPLLTTISTFRSIFSNKETMDFFKQAMQ